VRKLPLIAAVTTAMWILPASAGDGVNIPSKPEVTLAQLNLCVGPDCRRDRERRYYDRSDDWRYRHGDNWGDYRGSGCRDVTVRERRGGEVVVKHIRRCD
jgi:hypothetical protein